MISRDGLNLARLWGRAWMMMWLANDGPCIGFSNPERQRVFAEKCLDEFEEVVELSLLRTNTGGAEWDNRRRRTAA